MTIKQGKRKQFFRRALWMIAIILVFALVQVLRKPEVTRILEALEAPRLPRLAAIETRVHLDQNWSAEVTQKFHHITQGSQQLFIPMRWFLALEQPASNVFALPFRTRDRFADNDYLLRFGFIESPRSNDNPHGLPIGFSATPFQQLPGIGRQATAVGFTCAACHTGRITHAGTEYVIEGGAASIDFMLLHKAMEAALGQTLVSSIVPGLGGRFERFAKNTLGDDAYTQENVALLKKELKALVEYVSALPKMVATAEGYSRLDAINRIGNTVFAWDSGRFENFVAPDSPVTFPHIWTASWFDWVQYDGSIMGPLIRNAGEAVGLDAYLDFHAPTETHRFSSSVDMNKLWWIERALAGDEPPSETSPLSGLRAPRWPEELTTLSSTEKTERIALGKTIYDDICIHCHLPPLSSAEVWRPPHFKPIEYFIDGVPYNTKDSLLHLNLISIDQVGTDPARAEVMIERTVNTAAIVRDEPEHTAQAMGINAVICTPSPAPPSSPYSNENPLLTEFGRTNLVNVQVSDGPAVNFALALGSIVQQLVDQWFAQNYIAAEDQAQYEGDRPNCLRAGRHYKARPLNGIWATAPFLHNGSIPTIYDLLSPPDSRPKHVQLGSPEFDAEKVGIKQDPTLRHRPGDKYARNSLFILDTSLPGNSNRGHEFSAEWDPEKDWSEQKKGVLGPEFTHEQRLAVIEYLKTL